MDHPVKTVEVGEKVIEIHTDENPESPRHDETLGTMVCFHGRYNLPHEAEYRSEDYNGWDAMEADIVKQEKPVVMLPVYMYDHSGLAFSTTPFSCPWDSGQVGFIYASPAKVKAWFGVTAITAKIREHTQKILMSEVEAYNQYSQGDVYGYVIKSKNGEVKDSCWGFYGVDYAVESAMEAV